MQHHKPFGGLVLIEPVKHSDCRGFFSEVYNQARYLEDYGISCDFVQDNQSLSISPGVLRGLHFQIPPFGQDKLVRVTRGSVADVAVDVRAGSPTFGDYFCAELSAENWKQLFIPVGFAHGFCTLSANTEFLYKVSGTYSRDHERGIVWNDCDLGIDWPVTDPVISEKDQKLPALKELPDFFRILSQPVN